MLKKKIIPVFLASVLTVSGTTGFVTEAFSENVYAAEEVHTERLADFADLLDDGQEVADIVGIIAELQPRCYRAEGESAEGSVVTAGFQIVG